jgi:hypothetical protein
VTHHHTILGGQVECNDPKCLPQSWRFEIGGSPRTKKTSSQGVVVQRPGMKPRAVMFPAKEWREWVRDARIISRSSGDLIVYDRKAKRAIAIPELGSPIAWIPLGSLYNCAALIYLSNRQHGDTLGYLQGLADLLEARRVVDNDRQLVTWDGSRCIHSGAVPHVDVTLTLLENPHD